MGNRLIAVWWCLGVLLVTDTVAQVERVLPRRNRAVLEGTEFLIGFMENEVPASQAPVELRIFLASEFRANVTVELPNGQLDRYTVQPEQVQVVTIDASWMANRSESVERKALRVWSDVPIVVYVLNSRVMSTDTYTAIPVKHFGMEYMVMSRGVDRYRINLIRPNPQFDTASRQSEFMILANENNTTVWITPTAQTERGLQPNVPATLTLMRGESYLVKGARGPSGQYDLTGTRISADKPIGVLSGHVRTSIPRRDQFNKDHLAEMLVPMDKWGFDHITTPFSTSSVGDVVRVMAANDGTVVTAETAAGQTTYTIPNAGGWIEFNNVNYPVRWTSTQPVMVAQFMLSQQMSQSDIMDPAMVIVPPVERYVDRAVFRTPELLMQPTADPTDYIYYFSVIADVEAIPTLTANGARLASIDPAFATRFVPGTRKVWASFQLNPATVVIRCDTGTFSGVMYGVGPADSYANIYGISLDPRPKIELTPPKYALKVDCGTVEGTIADVAITRPFLQEVTVQASRTFNYDHVISAPIDSMGTVEVMASVRDLWRDARLVIHAWDSLGNGREWEYTYDAPAVSINAAVIDVQATPACTTVVFRNRDTSSVRLRNVRLTGDPRYRLARNVTDVMVPAGDSLLVEVCLDAPYAPPAPPATVSFDLPCGLVKTTTVRPSAGASFTTFDFNAGTIRVGDTIYGAAGIINDGIEPITITGMWLAQEPSFVVDTAAMRFPRVIQPSDTLPVPVRFVPNVVGAITRTDSVFSQQGIRGTITWDGGGVAPTIPDMEVDWGRRRAGLRYDSTMQFLNIGSAGCRVSFIDGDPSTVFDYAGAVDTVILNGPGRSQTLPIAYAPSVVGSSMTQLRYLVDWFRHDTVTVTLLGTGTLPEFVTRDVDMGTVVVGNRQDSTVDVGQAGGNESLTIDTMWVEGADPSAFVIDRSILDVRRLVVDDLLQGVITFVPQRVGRHDADLVIVHDAAPAFARRTSRVRLTGIGVVPDTVQWEVNTDVAATVMACVDTPLTITVRNTGIVTFNVDRIDVRLDGTPLSAVTGDAVPRTMLAGATASWSYVVLGQRGDGGVIDVSVVRDDGSIVDVQRMVAIEGHDVQLDVTPSVTVQPGQTMEMSSRLRVQGPSLAQSYVVRHKVGRDRWHVSSAVIEATLAGRSTPVVLDVARSDDAVTLSTREALTAPVDLTWKVEGTALWKDPAPFVIETMVEAGMCTDEATGTSNVTADICGSELRMVRFGAIPITSVQVTPQPAREHLQAAFTATEDMVVSAELISVSGEVVWHVEKIDLKKGLTLCKFSCSTMAGGVYRLRVGQGIGMISVPVVIVN